MPTRILFLILIASLAGASAQENRPATRASATVNTNTNGGETIPRNRRRFQQSFGPTTPFETPGIELKPFVVDYRHATNSIIDLSFLLDAPAGKDGFIRVKGDQLVEGNGKPIRFWGFNITEWSHGSTEVPSKEDAPMWADVLARAGVNIVRLQFLDLPAPRGLIDGTRDDSQHFDPAQVDNEDFFLAELMKRGIYIDFNLNVGRQFKSGDKVLAVREGKGPLLFDKRLIELEKDYAKQLLTHVNPYTKRAYVDEPGVAIVEIVNEDTIGIGWNSSNAFDQELNDLFNAWLVTHVAPEKLTAFRKLAGVEPGEPIPRLKGAGIRNAPKERYYTECKFFSDLQSGFFRDMSDYMKNVLGVKCPLIATADHSHSGSGYPLEADAQQLDIMDGHDYWRHPNVPPFRHSPMVNDPLNSTVVELSRTAIAGKPYTVSEINNPWPNQFACEGIPIMAAYADFLKWNGVMWYTFEPKKSADWQPVLTEPFDMSHDPMKMAEMAAGALMFIRGDLAGAKETVERSYRQEEVWDSRFATNRPYFTPDFPMPVPLEHGSRIVSLNATRSGDPIHVSLGSPLKSDTGQLVWYTNFDEQGLVTIDSPRSQGLVGFVKANGKHVSNFSASTSNNFCAIILCSLDLKPISETSRMLLVTGSRVGNSGMTWNSAGSLPADWGRSPTVIEPVTGSITLCNLRQARAVSAIALDGSGHPTGSAIFGKKNGAGWEIVIGQIVTPWYEIRVDR